MPEARDDGKEMPHEHQTEISKDKSYYEWLAPDKRVAYLERLHNAANSNACESR